MNTASKITLALAATLGFSAAAYAQPRHAHPQQERVVVVREAQVRHAPPARYAPPVRYVPQARHAPPVRYVQNRNYRDHRFADYHRGQRMPSAYRGQQYVVTDWRAQRLSAPPSGHQWVRDGNSGRDFALIAVATGLIAQIVLSR